MAIYNANKLIGKEIITTDNVIAFYDSPLSSNIFTIKKNTRLAIKEAVYPKLKMFLFWGFEDKKKRKFYIIHFSHVIKLVNGNSGN